MITLGTIILFWVCGYGLFELGMYLIKRKEAKILNFKHFVMDREKPKVIPAEYIKVVRRNK